MGMQRDVQDGQRAVSGSAKDTAAVNCSNLRLPASQPVPLLMPVLSTLCFLLPAQLEGAPTYTFSRVSVLASSKWHKKPSTYLQVMRNVLVEPEGPGVRVQLPLPTSAVAAGAESAAPAEPSNGDIRQCKASPPRSSSAVGLADGARNSGGRLAAAQSTSAGEAAALAAMTGSSSGSTAALATAGATAAGTLGDSSDGSSGSSSSSNDAPCLLLMEPHPGLLTTCEAVARAVSARMMSSACRQ